MRDPEQSARPEVTRRIVVLRPNHRIGNTLLLTPLAQQLEAQFPSAQIDLVTAGGVARTIFARYPQVQTQLAFPAMSYRHPIKVLQVLWQLRRQSYDLAIDPTIRSRAGRFLLGWVRARRRLGYAWGVPGKDRILTDAVTPASAPAHHAEIPVYLVRVGLLSDQAGAAVGAAARVPMDLRLGAAERREGMAELAGVLGESKPGDAPIVGLFAHATGAKCLAPEWWRTLVDELRRRAPSVRIVEFLPDDARTRLDGIVPATFTPELRVLAAKLAATSLVVIADGGILHLADAAGARVLALFTSTAPSQYGPRGRGSESMLANDAAPDVVAARILAKLRA